VPWERLALLKHAAHEIAEELEGVAKRLNDYPETIDWHREREGLKNYHGLECLIDDIKKTYGELSSWRPKSHYPVHRWRRLHPFSICRRNASGS
jgi:hypothetical protein